LLLSFSFHSKNTIDDEEIQINTLRGDAQAARLSSLAGWLAQAAGLPSMPGGKTPQPLG